MSYKYMYEKVSMYVRSTYRVNVSCMNVMYLRYVHAYVCECIVRAEEYVKRVGVIMSMTYSIPYICHIMYLYTYPYECT